MLKISNNNWDKICKIMNHNICKHKLKEPKDNNQCYQQLEKILMKGGMRLWK